MNAAPATASDGDPAVRDAIGIARVLCILGIVYVHAWTGRDGDTLIALARTPQGMLRWMLIELVGRSAVPLLGAISGWLVAASAERRGYRGFVAVKARTILLPMLVWNALAMLLVSGAAHWGTLKAPVPASFGEALDWIGCVAEPNPINVQIAFLRDLFACMLMAPALARLDDRRLALVAAAVLAWTVAGVDLYLLLRPQILLFFIAGMAARRHGIAERVASWPPVATLAPYLALVLPKILLSIRAERWLQAHVAVADAIDLPLRFAAALAVWRVATLLARRPAGRVVVRGERYAFLLFCCHLVFIWLLGPIAGFATGPLGAPGYPPFLLAQPLLALALAVLLGRALETAAPAAARLLSGGRLAGRLPAAPGSAKERANPFRSAA